MCIRDRLNTIVAEALCQFADILEGAGDFPSELHNLIRDTYRQHNRIVFNGNNYSDEWAAEAKRRGLLNLKTTVDALPYLVTEKNIALFQKHHIFSGAKMHSRYEILLENYCKTLNIEALAMLDMVKKDIIPAVCAYSKDLCEGAAAKKALDADLDCDLEWELVSELSSLGSGLYKKARKLESDLLGVKSRGDLKAQADCYKDVVFCDMRELRAAADELELLIGGRYWPFPTYGKLLFGI